MRNLDKVIIIAPDNNNPEREYAVQSLFSLLDTDYELRFDGSSDQYCIQYKKLTILIKDDFFGSYPKPLSYLNKDSIPTHISFLRLDHDKEVAVLFGEPKIDFKKSTIICGVDIFAATFFMLTRWEEFVLDKKNNFGKVDEDELLAVRHGFFDRPIVNEYASLLCHFFNSYGYKVQLKKLGVEVVITHDVDWIQLSTVKALLKNLKNMLANKELKRASKALHRYLHYKALGVNPFDSFDEIMDYSDKYKFKNSFYFKACKPYDKGFTYQLDNPFCLRTIKNIEKRGHRIGFHPSENTLANYEHFKIEISRLRNVAAKDVVGGRAHHLLYDINSWREWERASLKYDSGFGFQYRNGFRCGITSSYEVFDLKARKKLQLKQVPFLLMDSTWLRSGSTPQAFFENAKRLIEVVVSYGGVVCINWHSNLFNVLEMRDFRDTYFQIVDYLGVVSEKN